MPLYMGWLWRTIQSQTQRKRRSKLCKYLGMSVADRKSNLRWSSNPVHKTGQGRTTLLKTRWEVPRESFAEP